MAKDAKHRARLVLEQVAEDPQVIERFPRTSKVLSEVAASLFDAINEVDRAIGGEESQPDAQLDRALVDEIVRAVIETSAEIELEEGEVRGEDGLLWDGPEEGAD